MADIRITPAASVMAFTSSLSFLETLTQGASGSIVLAGSGSTGRTNLFAIDGNNGRLFSVDDDLSDSLFSVNTIAGLPVIEAFANNTVIMGQYGQNVLVVTGSRVGVGIANPGVRFVNAFATNAPGPTLGSGTVGAQALLSINGLYGMYSGIADSGDVWHQVQRNDSNTAVYNLRLQPSGGYVNIVNSSVILGTDGTYGTSYGMVGFGGTTNGSNRIIASTGTADNMYFMAATGRGFNFRVNGNTTDTFYIDGAGEVTSLQTIYINDSVPLAFTNSGTGNNQTLIYANTTNNLLIDVAANAPYVNFKKRGQSTSTMYLDTTNYRVGLGGITASAATLHVGGDVYATGDVIAYYSDERLKKNITPIDSALSKINLIRAVTYDQNELANSYLGENLEKQVGVLAQDIQQVLPEAVKPAPFDLTVDENGNIVSKTGENYLTVQYIKLVPLLIASIQELTTKVNNLEEQLKK